MVERINKREGKLLARDELKRALEELKGAEILQDSNLFFKSVVSSYYAVYHAAKAALLLSGVCFQIRRFSGSPGIGKIFC